MQTNKGKCPLRTSKHIIKHGLFTVRKILARETTFLLHNIAQKDTTHAKGHGS